MRTSIQTKLVLAVVGCMLLLVLAATYLVTATAREMQQEDARRALRSAATAFAGVERAEIEKLSIALDAILANAALRDAFAARDRARLLALSAPLFEQLRERYRVTHLYFIDREPARTAFLRVHQPALHGDVVQRATLARAIETKALGAGKELGQTAFALRVVKPWRGPDGALIGYVELGEEIDQFLAQVKGVLGGDLGLAVAKRHLDGVAWATMIERTGRRNSWGDRPDAVVVNATVDDPRLANLEGWSFDALPEEGLLLEEWPGGERLLQRGVVPVGDAGGRVVGGLFVLHDATAEHARAAGQRNLLVAAIALAALVLTGLLLLLLRRLVLARLQRMMETLEAAGERLAGGDAAVGDAIVPSGSDEIGRFEEFFGRFLRVVGELVRSHGDQRPVGSPVRTEEAAGQEPGRPPRV